MSDLGMLRVDKVVLYPQHHFGGQMRFSTNYPATYIILFLMFAMYLSAQWSTNPAINNAISTAAIDQTYPSIVNDGSGGAIIVWQDARSGTSYDIYAQKINASGVVQWKADGVPISTANGNQMIAAIASDGLGGAIITWSDGRNGLDYIFAQRINSSGVVQWTADGVEISSAIGFQTDPTIISDGLGGAIITWRHFIEVSNTDIYAQKISASGNVQWTVNGVAISIAADNQLSPTMVSDGSGGAIITWYDYRNSATTGSDIYAQRINASGAVQWIADGVALCVATGGQLLPAIVSDGTGGAIITWQDLRSGAVNNIYAQRINTFGTVEWTVNGVPIATLTGLQSIPKIVSDGSGGAIITWEDNGKGPTFDIYAQKINPDGNAQWITNGLPISTANGDQTIPKIVSDGSGGAIITWLDTRNGISNRDIYTQKINSSGAVQWKLDGVAITTALNNQFNPTIVGDGLGGAIITWYDSRGSSFDIYAQKVDKYGFLGQAAPNLVAVKDIANDQGGKLRLFWDPSYLDTEPNQIVKSYTLKLGAKTKGIIGLTTGATGSGIYWQTADIIHADLSEGYSSVVTTFADSGLQGIPMYYFQVIAKNSDSTQAWYSNIDSGYSVDNIPPVGVGNAVIASNAGLVFLKWNKDVVDKDLMEYRIYRSTTSGFAISTATKMKATTDTTFTDSTGTNGITYYYHIAAVDVHGNIGAPSEELNQKVLAVQGTRGVTPNEFMLEQNYPNPFNPTTMISYQLSSKGYVSLKVYDAIGREVASFVNEVKEAGYYSVPFDGSKLSSGIYLTKLQSGDKAQFKKMLLIK
jgi:hypothetical protein